MKSTPITVYSGLAYIDEEYIEVITKDGPFDLSGYDIRFQLRDLDNNKAIIESITLTADSENTNWVWPEMTAAITAALVGVNAAWLALIRKTSTTENPRIIGFGPVNVEMVAPAGEDVWQ